MQDFSPKYTDQKTGMLPSTYDSTFNPQHEVIFYKIHFAVDCVIVLSSNSCSETFMMMKISLKSHCHPKSFAGTQKFPTVQDSTLQTKHNLTLFRDIIKNNSAVKLPGYIMKKTRNARRSNSNFSGFVHVQCRIESCRNSFFFAKTIWDSFKLDQSIIN